MKFNFIPGTLVLMITAAAPDHAARAASFGEDALFLKKHTELIVLSDSAGVGKVALARLAGPRHDEYGGRRRRSELWLDQPRTDRVQEDRATHECVWRRGSVLVGTGRGTVFDLLCQRGEV